MGYKLKPNKAVKKRFRATATGKLKRGHSLTSHLRSARTSKKKRELRRPEILFEGIARNMRKLMGLGHKHPNAARKRAAVLANATGTKTTAPKATVKKAKATAKA
jgi:large subunit ribosomal protein L35